MDFDVLCVFNFSLFNWLFSGFEFEICAVVGYRENKTREMEIKAVLF